MKRVLFMVLTAVLAGLSQACASAGYTGFTGLAVPGYEAAGVVAGNQALIGAIAGQQGWLPYGQPYSQFGNVPVCRARDLVGLPPISISQPMIVRVSKSKRHRTADIIGGAAIGAGLGGWSGGWQGATYGSVAGAGGGLLVSNHEQDLCLLLPVRAP